jgi:DNA-binding NtrC family response regulator
MTRHPTTASVGVPRAGRLIETPAGLMDLATGSEARFENYVVPHADAPEWQPQAIGVVSPRRPRVCVDSWLTQDWLGRWVARVVTIDAPPAALDSRPADAADERWPRDWPANAIGVTRTDGSCGWHRLAAGARAHGIVPVHHSMLVVIGETASPPEWPALLVGVDDETRLAGPGALTGWVSRGGRVAALSHLGGLETNPRRDAVASSRAGPDPPSRQRACLQSRPAWARGAPGQAAAVRLLHRAWRTLQRAPACPAFIWMRPPAGGRDRMTHLELLDVSTQLDEVRRDEDAFAVACRAVRVHTQADHAVLAASRGSDVRILASDGVEGDSMLAWRQLASPDAPDALVTSRGWHTVGRHEMDQGSCLLVGACWPSREAAQGRQHLLAVFARLVAGRTSAPLLPAAPAAPGLEQTLVGESTVMRDVRAQIALAARAPFPVLIRGESGCGKELAARAIHSLGQRRHRRCAAINCAALPDDLIESELFGHVRGAFTGAASDRMGLFDEADGGTLFLDEVGELGGRAQAKLLRVLQDGEVRRVGENQSRRVDVRVIAATNVSLEEAVRRGTFRADLFYRLDVVRVRMPALRERREDIPVLARHFWHDCTARVGSRARLEGRVLDVLAQSDWPGNVRQLQNALAALAVRVPPRGRVTIDDLPEELRKPDLSSAYLPHSGLDAARREFEASYVRDALTRAGGRSSLAARDLGVTRQGLSKIVRRLGLDEDELGSRLP